MTAYSLIQDQTSEDANFSTDQNGGHVKDKSQSTSFQEANSMAGASNRGKTGNLINFFQMEEIH